MTAVFPAGAMPSDQGVPFDAAAPSRPQRASLLERANPLAKLFLLGVLWAFLHHACAGVRYLLMDVHVGVDLPAARMSAKLVLAVSLALTAIIGGLTW